ncbi:MAG: BrnT family toxin [Planctomycetota bacterium]|nr:BrnT family toxin [Planctomycetota bacterium]
MLDDPDHSLDEDRAVLVGLSARLRIVVVCHTVRDGGRTIRLISARRATRQERDQYLEQVMP